MLIVGILVGIVVAGIVALNVLAYNHARAMLNFTTGGDRTCRPEALGIWHKLKVLIVGVNIPRPAGHRSARELCTDCRVMQIEGTDGITLEAWYCDRGTATPLVILFHGYAVEKCAVMDEAGAFLKLGTSVMLVDFRGSGGSSESYTTIGVCESKDVASVAEYVRENLSHSGIILFGQSMGAVAILQAIHSHGVRPNGLILEAVFDTMLNTVRNRFRSMRVPSFPSAEILVFWGGVQRGFNGFRHNPIDYAASVQCPVLVMHGRDDPRAKLEEGRRVFDAIPGAKEFVTFENVGHESYVSAHRDQWLAAVKKVIT